MRQFDVLVVPYELPVVNSGFPQKEAFCSKLSLPSTRKKQDRARARSNHKSYYESFKNLFKNHFVEGGYHAQ